MNGIRKHSFIFWFTLILCILGYTSTAISAGCGNYRCQIIGVSLKEKASNRNTYSVVAECDYLPYAGGACPPGSKRTVKGIAWWDKILKLAYENIHNTYTEEFLIDTLSKCSQNPWIGPIDCTTMQQNIISIFPLPAAPVSARLMSGNDKAVLAQQEADAVTMIQAPYFREPKDNAEFQAPATIQFVLRHHAQYQVGFDIQYKSSLADDWENIVVPNDWYNTDHRQSSDGSKATSVFDYYLDSHKTGLYRIKAHCRAENAHDSEWRNFTLIPPLAAQIIQPVQDQSFALQENVTIKATHHPNYTIYFSFQRKPVQEEGTWPIAPTDIVPTLQTCDRNTPGETSCQYTFSETGLYHVYAHYTEELLLPVSSQSFIITGSKINQLKIKPTIFKKRLKKGTDLINRNDLVN